MSGRNRARQLRGKASEGEKLLWRLLRSRRLSGYKFRRQHPEGSYFLDFYCVEARVAVETDGFQHGFPAQKSNDQKRTDHLNAQGIVVKRIWNSHLRQKPEREAFLAALSHLLQERAPHRSINGQY